MKSKIFLVLVILSLLPLWPLFKPRMFFGHDTVSHIVRVASFYDSLKEGHIVPRWSKDLNAGFGHPIFMFLYPLPNYLASFFHFLGFSLTSSLKLVFGLSFVFSGIFVFLWLKELFGQKAALAGSLLYLFCPYRFVDMYVRAALGECLAFAFVPLVFYFLEKLAKKGEYKFLLGGSLSLAGLILSHNAIGLMFLPLILLYTLFLIYSKKGKVSLSIIHYPLSILLGFSLSCFFWLPSLYEGKYTLRDIVISPNEVLSRFPKAKELFLPPLKIFGVTRRSNSLSFYLGLPQILVCLSIPYLIFKLKKKKNSLWLLVFFCLFLYIVTVFMLLETSKPVWKAVSVLQKFQFPWRLLALTTFLPAILGAGLVFVLKKENLVLLLVALAVFSTFPFWQPVDYLWQTEEEIVENYIGTTDTGESTPRWSIRGIGKRAEVPVEVIEGKAEIEILERISTRHILEVKAEKRSRLVDNTLYFPGWQVFVDREKASVEFQDPNYRGLMTFFVPEGKHRVEVTFSETRFRTISDLISIFGLGILIFVGIIRRRLILR